MVWAKFCGRLDRGWTRLGCDVLWVYGRFIQFSKLMGQVMRFYLQILFAVFVLSISYPAVLDTSGFTLGIWSVPLNQFDSIGQNFEVVANPFNTSDPVKAKIFLDTCQKHGLSGIIGVDCQSLGNTTYLNNLVSAVKNHSAYSAMMLYDEPLANTQWCQPISVQLAKSAYTAIKSADPIHPLFIDDYQTQSTTSPVVAYKDAYDFFTSDYYAISSDGTLPLYRDALSYFYTSAFPKPYIALIQLHQMDGSYYKLPTAQQERLITYMPIVAGAKGIMYYSFDGESKALSNPVLWTYVKKLAGELKTLKPVLASPNLEGKVSISPTTAKIGAAIKKYQNKYYLIAYNYAHTGNLSNTVDNPSAQAVSNIKFTITGLSKGSIKTIGGAGLTTSEVTGRTLSLNNGSFTDSFDSFAVHIYEIDTGDNAIISVQNEAQKMKFSVTLSSSELLLTHCTICIGDAIRVDLVDPLGRVVWSSSSQASRRNQAVLSWRLNRNSILNRGIYFVRVYVNGLTFCHRVAVLNN